MYTRNRPQAVVTHRLRLESTAKNKQMLTIAHNPLRIRLRVDVSFMVLFSFFQSSVRD